MSEQNWTSSERRYLKSQAHHLKPVMQIGKEGVSSGFLVELDQQLDIHELMKLRVLNNCEFDIKSLTEGVEGSGAAVIQKVGHVLTVFRQRKKDSAFQIS